MRSGTKRVDNVWPIRNDLVPNATVSSMSGQDDIRAQGRLHHINDGANAPWKSRGKVFAGT